MALDHASSQFLQQLADQGAPALHTLSVTDARTFFSTLREIIGEGPTVDRSEEFSITSDMATVTLRALVPSPEPDGIIVYLHGGGWVVGDLDDYDTLARFIAIESNCAVVLVDYRLAPEHPFPAAINDAWTALEWVADNQSKVSGVDTPLPLIVAGDSAGGNLAAVVARKSQGAGGPALAQQILIYPVTQPDLGTPSYQDPANQGLLSQADMVWFWKNYVPNSAQRQDPDVSPLLAKDLSGLPPAVVITAEHDVLSGEGAAYARRLEEAGVPVTYHQFKGQIHGFFTILNALPESIPARELVVSEIGRAIREANTANV
ncbi:MULTISPECIES: alpha/beta hydrolase [unclassified Marinobacter]|uniref:alpha/beta hydrolase n=1 Tax=unclassified Marinobacter TaxID=83889 RepID=UPI0019281A5F|nr:MULTISPECIES: alpha/beta hydrolase [unclassified Marinobacter]MBL3827234.1 alpha/beta hydrolase [Marinobacter sp. MC3]MBL3895676.1 alpha/beta hydrolase [Marinobacter sp. MW3]